MRVAVLGLGSIGTRHATNLIKLGHEVTAYDPLVREAPHRNLIMRGSRDEALDDPRVALVVIASPSDCHLDDMRASLKRFKPTFVEKPIATEITAELSAMAEGPLLFVGYNLRFHAAVIQAEEWIAQGQIGTPLWGTFCVGQYTNKTTYLRDSVVLNWSHEIDLALHLLGPAKVITAAVRERRGIEDWADIILEHDNGARSIVHLDYVLEPEVRATMIVGDKGAIVIDLVRRMAALKPKGADQLVRRFEDSWDHNYVSEMRAFIDRCKGKKTRGATGADGLAALRICCEARRIGCVPSL